MALSGMIRKASLSVVPITLRAIGSSATLINGTILPATPQRNGSLNLNQSHNYYGNGPTANSRVDIDVCKALINQIEYAKSKLKKEVKMPPESFPFKIEDDPSSRTLILTRKFPDDHEAVTVKIDTYALNIEEEIESDGYTSRSSDDSFEDDNDISYDKKRDGSEKDSNEDDGESKLETDLEGYCDNRVVPAIPMTVTIKKIYEESSLDFKITVSTENIVIDSLFISITDEEKKLNVSNLEGPKFKELDFELQRLLYKFLENRGIKGNIVSFLFEYIAEKKKKDDLQALRHLKKVIHY